VKPDNQDSGDESGRPGAVRELLGRAGIGARRLRTAIRLLTERRLTLAELIRESGVDRRTVEALLAALGDDLVRDHDRLHIAAAAEPAYRALARVDQLAATDPADPLAPLVAANPGLVDQVRRWVAEAPPARASLDHVPATPETVARRALWLEATFDLDDARLLCLGDHDLTSLAVASVNPRPAVTVVDVDDAVLAYIDAAGLTSVRCLWSDLRFGLAPGARGWGDLVFADPPYTPDGVRLFLGRGLEGLRQRDQARLVLAYGFGADHPGLGLKVQQAVSSLNLVYEAVLPRFNRYDGAQAVGSSSDLYVLRPSVHSPQGLSAKSVNIYTHGAQSLEGVPSAPDDDVASALQAAAAGPSGLPVVTVGPGERVPLAAVFAGPPPASLATSGVAVNLSGDPGGWLVRVLLAVNAPRLALLVPNNHPDLANEAAQRSLRETVGVKYRLTLRRSTPGPRHAIVEATRIDPGDLDPAQRTLRAVLDRAHGKVGNTWREALIRAAAVTGATMTKNEARARIRELAATTWLLDEPLLWLPRHRITEVIRTIGSRHSAPAPASPGQTS
jgi:hypothetical protein